MTRPLGPEAGVLIPHSRSLFTTIPHPTCPFKPRPNDRNMPTQHVATLLGAICCDMLPHDGCCWLKFETGQIEPTTPNMLQHIATRWPNIRNMLRPTMLRYVALTCCDRLAGALDLGGDNFSNSLQKGIPHPARSFRFGW